VSIPLRDSETKEPPGRSIPIDQAAHLMNVSRRTVYNWIRQGRLRTTPNERGAMRVLVQSLFDLGFKPQAFSASASAASFDIRDVSR
jgi:excisionase family DNA binding protein